MILHLTRNSSSLRVPLRLPASPAEKSEAFAKLDTISTDMYSTRIADVTSFIPNLARYIKSADINGPDFKKLNRLAEKLNCMTESEQQIFSTALDAESVDGLDDILSIADNLDVYTFLPNICSDKDLGAFLVNTGYINFPEHLWSYINYESIGAEYCADFGGTYSPFGYVRRKDAEPKLDTEKEVVFTARLQAGDRRCILKLPATDAWLNATCRRLQVNDFCEIELTDLECAIPDLDDLLPQDCISVGDTNKLALAIQEMQQTDGELLKYLSVLSIEQPKDFPDALRLALELDNYERVPSAPEEYGKEVLGRIGGEDAVEAVDGYMNFQCFGEDMMAEDGVHHTEFGAVRRLNDPSSQQGQTFQ